VDAAPRRSPPANASNVVFAPVETFASPTRMISKDCSQAPLARPHLALHAALTGRAALWTDAHTLRQMFALDLGSASRLNPGASKVGAGEDLGGE
jgi:hypothetical protein